MGLEGHPTLPPVTHVFARDLTSVSHDDRSAHFLSSSLTLTLLSLFHPHRDVTDSAQASIDSQRATARAGYALDLQSKEQRKAAARLQQQQLQQRAGGVRGGGEGAEGAEGGERGEGGGGGGASGLVAPSWVRCVHACMHAVVFFVGTLDAPEPGCCSSGARN